MIPVVISLITALVIAGAYEGNRRYQMSRQIKNYYKNA